jgi:hypothetical protein
VTPEGGESSWRIKLGSLVVLLASSLAKIYLSTHPDATEAIKSWTYEFVPHSIDLLLDALLIAGIISFLAETALLRDYIERRIRNLTDATRDEMRTQFEQLTKSEFTAHVTDVNYLRQFDAAFRKKAESSIRRTFFERNVPPEVDMFLETLAALREKLVVWRSNYRLIATYCEVADKPHLYKLITELRWTYVNYSEEAQTFTQMLSEPILPIEGVQPENQYKRTKLEIGGVDYMARVPTQVKEVGSRKIVESEFPIVVPPSGSNNEGIPFVECAELIQRKTEPFVLTFFRPVFTLTFSLHHPKQIQPSLYVFGVSPNDVDTDPLDPCENTDTYHRWEYKGWLLPDHGAILTLPES